MKAKLLSIATMIFINLTAYAGVETSTDENNVILAGHDAVAYFTDNKPVKGSDKYKALYNEATYLFSSAENRDLFEENPAKYAPQFGGYCSFGTAQGGKYAVDGQGFKIVNGKLFVNKSPYVHELWLKNQDELITIAKENWKRIKTIPASDL